MTAPQADSLRRHFDQQVSLYGDQFLVNLVNSSGYEKPVKEAYERALAALGNERVHYTYFDFHKECKGLRFDRVGVLIDQLHEDLERQGSVAPGAYGILPRIRSSRPATDSTFGSVQVLLPRRVDFESAAAETDVSRPYQLHGLVRRWLARSRAFSVLLRVSEADCDIPVRLAHSLDRTNVVQSALGKWVLNNQLRQVGVLSVKESIEEHATFLDLFRNGECAPPSRCRILVGASGPEREKLWRLTMRRERCSLGRQRGCRQPSLLGHRSAQDRLHQVRTSRERERCTLDPQDELTGLRMLGQDGQAIKGGRAAGRHQLRDPLHQEQFSRRTAARRVRPCDGDLGADQGRRRGWVAGGPAGSGNSRRECPSFHGTSGKVLAGADMPSKQAPYVLLVSFCSIFTALFASSLVNGMLFL